VKENTHALRRRRARNESRGTLKTSDPRRSRGVFTDVVGPFDSQALREERKATRAAGIQRERNNTRGFRGGQITGFDRSNTPET
ncbi:hypothetical protein K0M31_015645, partial [Melipona bicolor]